MAEREKRRKRCCFTGHRPEKLQSSESVIKTQLTKAIDTALDAGITTFISGMSRGTDIWAAEIVLQRRSQNPEIRLICALPYSGFEKRWSIRWQQRYSEILRNADLVKVVCPAFSMDSYQKRNAWMVDHSALVIAVFSGQAGGTQNTIDYAEKQGIGVVLIWDGREPRYRTLRQME